MVIADAHKKWPEIIEMRNTTAEETVKQPRTVMSRMGISKQLVTHNGPQFTSEVFQIFYERQRHTAHHRRSVSPGNQRSRGTFGAQFQEGTEGKQKQQANETQI